MESENERLKTQLAQANAGIVNCSGCKLVEINAVNEFAEKVKEYINDNADFVYKSECGEYAEINITLCEKYINELLREYE